MFLKKFLELFMSVIGAMIGVQSNKKRIKDFERVEKEGPWMFIFMGIFMTVLFIFIVITVVKLALSQ